MSSFAALMELSASQTKQSEAAVKSAIAERQKKEASKRKQQEEKDAKDREIERKLRLKHLEEQKRDQERQQRLEAERRRKEEELKRKEHNQRDALLYGPKRSKSEYPSSSSGARDAVRRQRLAVSDDEDDGGGSALTREEKRRLRLQRELNYGTSAGRRATAPGYRKAGRRLPGGAVDSPVGGGAPSGSYRSVKERLAHEPPALIKLNVNKRDTRTIDEILQDRAKQKATRTLAGEDAKDFNNWFGKSKVKADSANEVSRASSVLSSRSNSPESKPSVRAQSSPSKSLSSTPPAASRPPAASKPVSTAGLSSSVSRLSVNSLPSMKGSGIHVKSVGARPTDRSLASNGPLKSMSMKKLPPPEKAPVRPSASSNRSSSKLPSSAMKKRQRSGSLSDSPPPHKKRPQAPQQNSISSEIWKLFGKDRNTYVARDVFSDDEGSDDMEVGAREVEHEEAYRSVFTTIFVRHFGYVYQSFSTA